MNRLLHLYPYFAAAVLAPLSAYLWWQTYQNLMQLLLAWLIPILWAYIVSGVGTNICKVWEVKSRFNLGKFRVQHGFVFGSATSVLVWLIHSSTVAASFLAIFKTAFIVASVLGFWNILYDIVAIRAGILYVYNQPFAEGKGVDAIVMDYAPWLFGGFGFCYGLTIASYEYLYHYYGAQSTIFNSLFFIGTLLLCITIPIVGFMHHSFKKHGHMGTKPINKGIIDPK